MPFYIVTAYCKKCALAHPTGVEFEWPDYISTRKSIAESFDGSALPPEVAAMSKNYFLCPHTGDMYKQTDSNRLFVATKFA
jgi:hypothetical protein